MIDKDCPVSVLLKVVVQVNQSIHLLYKTVEASNACARDQASAFKDIWRDNN